MAKTVERVAGWYAAWARRIREAGTADRVASIAIVLALIVGVALRFQGQLNHRPSLWQDEALWANHLFDQSLFSHNIRPIGFMWLTKLLVDVFGATEFWLRFIPNVTSIGALLLAPYVASQLTKSPLARVALVTLFALHPALIDFSKEFKPYSSEAFLHLAFVALYLRWRETRRKAWLVALLVALPVSVLFAYNLAFALPGLLLLAFIDGFEARRWRGALPAVASGAACLALLLVIYFTLLSKAMAGNTEKRWGRKYDVFYREAAAASAPVRAPAAPPSGSAASAAVSGQGGDDGDGDESARAEAAPPTDTRAHDQPETPAASGRGDKPASASRIVWLATKYADVAALPGLRRSQARLPSALGSLPSLERILWIALHLVALGMLLARRRYRELLLLSLPLLVVVVCNFAGLWPLGAFRTNLFLCVYSIGIASIGIDALAVTAVRQGALAVVLGAIYLAPTLVLGTDWRGQKRVWTRESAMRTVVARVRDKREQQLAAKINPSSRMVVLTDLASYETLTFYLTYHEVLRERHRDFFRTRIKIQKLNRFQDSLPIELDRRFGNRSKAPPLVVVASKDLPQTQALLHAKTRVLDEEIVDGEHLVAVVVPLKSP